MSRRCPPDPGRARPKVRRPDAASHAKSQQPICELIAEGNSFFWPFNMDWIFSENHNRSAKMTSQTELDDRLRDVPGYLGAFGAGSLPELLSKAKRSTISKSISEPIFSENRFSEKTRLIVNYSREGSPTGGTHWVGMVFPVADDALYFDSYGMPPDNFDNLLHTNTGFREYLQKHSFTGNFRYNTKDLQCFGPSDVCGEYAAEFVRLGTLPLEDPKGWRRAVPGIFSKRCSTRDESVFEAAGIRRHRNPKFPM